MTDVRVWLVERTYSDRDLLTLVYSTPDGEQYLQKELAGRLGGETTAAIEVEQDRLSSVTEDSRQQRYAEEVERMADKHDPSDTV
ncbi:hypothetical protein SAMN05421858_2586 [Haladaptatus litoreus]|uniref:DUF7967 domain-containing protein n=1 Tax=Haladaptatus litoreus TaxID=553468 RepID=A0A1N7BJK6_9EURY|nr:hypothetical protein [Haladaptatus litoreus]SIR51383.1 hypothetical protein SAMN05421858_2586 [Haladaptatus litoreus]